MNKLVMGFLIISGLAYGNDLEPKRYTMAELELMAKNKQWANVILAIKDIPKSDQDIQWNHLLERAAIGYVEELKKWGFSDAERMIHDIVNEFPSLKKSYKFEKLKTEFYLSGYENCFSNPANASDCVKSGLGVMSDQLTGSELRQKLGQLLYLKYSPSLEKICQILDSFKEDKSFFQKLCVKSNFKK